MVNTPTATAAAVGDILTLTWSNTDNSACVGSGLLAGVTAANGTLQAPLTTEGTANYGVTCGGVNSPTMSVAVLPQMTAVPDVVFAQALSNLGLTVTKGQVATTQVLGLTKLAILPGQGYCSSLGLTTSQCATTGTASIVDVTGLQNFRNLTQLRIEGQSFTTIDLSSLTQLQTLSLWQNPITQLDVSHNTALTTLGISETSLTSVDLSALVNLVELDAQNSGTLPYVLPSGLNVQGLTSLDLTTNVKLQRLFVSYNRLSLLDLTLNTLVTQAIVDHNQLTSLKLDANVQDYLEAEGNPNLTTIYSPTLTMAICANEGMRCQIDPQTAIVTSP